MFQKLILSETSIYDVLHDFFYHTNKLVCAAALEVGLSAKKLFLDVRRVDASVLACRCTCDVRT